MHARRAASSAARHASDAAASARGARSLAARELVAVAAVAAVAALSTSVGLGCKADRPRPEGGPAGEAPSDPEAIPELRVKRVDAAPTIDGKLDEAVWREAHVTRAFVNVRTGLPDARLPTGGTARVLYDAAHLYVGIEARDVTVRGGWPAGARDPHLWERDTVELMIDPEGDGDNLDYYEIQINPQNLVFDTHYDGYNRPNGGGKGPFGHEEWSAELVSAVTVKGTLDDDSDRDEGYTVEAKIPLAKVSGKAGPATKGTVWRVNFYAMQDNGGAAWSPILGKGNFHRASRFGRLVFE